MINIVLNDTQRNVLLGVVIAISFLVTGFVAYLLWINLSSPKYEENSNKALLANTKDWSMYSDRYSPIVFNHPKNWKIVSAHHTTSQVLIYAFINHEKSDEKLMLEISYHRELQRGKGSAEPNLWTDGGASVKPKCQHDSKEKPTSHDCVLVSSAVASGYMYESTTGRDDKKRIRWYGRTGDENIELEVSISDDRIVRSIIKSLGYSPSRTDDNKLISSADLQVSEKNQNEKNYKVLNEAAQSLSLKKCEEINGILYHKDFIDPKKLRVYDEWQALIICKTKVEAVIKATKGTSLKGDNCADIKTFSGLRRVLENVTIVQKNGGQPITVRTSAGNKSIIFRSGYWEDSISPHVDTTCQSLSQQHFNVGDTVSIYVLKSNMDPLAYTYDTRVMQKVNNTLPGPRLPFDPITNKPTTN